MEKSGSARLEAIELSVSHIVIGRNLLSASTHDPSLTFQESMNYAYIKKVGYKSVVG